MSNFQFFKEEQKKMKRYAIEAEEEKSIKFGNCFVIFIILDDIHCEKKKNEKTMDRIFFDSHRIFSMSNEHHRWHRISATLYNFKAVSFHYAR